MRKRIERNEEREEFDEVAGRPGRRLLILAISFCLFFVFLLFFLWRLQIMHGNSLAEKAQTRVLRNIRQVPVRGRIYSSDGVMMATNRAAVNLVFHVDEMRRGPRRKTIEIIIRQAYQMGQMLGRPLPFYEKDLAVVQINPAESFEQFRERHPEVYNSLCDLIEEHLYYHPAMPLTVYYDLTQRELALLEESLHLYSGVDTEVVYKRIYPTGMGTHILGFTSYSRTEERGFGGVNYAYVLPELRGRNEGLEGFYNDALSGKIGMRSVIVDSLGYYKSDYMPSVEPIHGSDLWLTIDYKMQELLEKAMIGKKGACVVIEVATGAVKAMVSAPTYQLERVNQADYYRLLREDDDGPLINRAVGSFSPGSIVKPLGILQALERGFIDGEVNIECDGRSKIGNAQIRCSNRYGHGNLNVTHALACSCNDFMIELVLSCGMTLEDFQDIYRAAGIGVAPKIDLPYVTAGLCPSREWVEEREHRKWTIFDSALITIGQGKIMLSPLQAALFTAAIANDGKLFRPYLVERIKSPNGEVVSESTPIVENILSVSPEYFEIVRSGMDAVVESSAGTARRLQNEIVRISGKTGSAQKGSGENRSVDSWFIGYAPSEAPQYAICVFVQDGIGGGTDAAPIAGELFRTYYQNKDEQQ